MRYAGVVVAMLAALACTESSAPATENYPGIYNLTLVNGKDLPGVVVDSWAGRSLVLDATLTLRDDQSFVQVRHYNTVNFLTTGQSSLYTVTENGTYSVVGSQITFSVPESDSRSARSYTGAISRKAVAFTTDEVAFEFRK